MHYPRKYATEAKHPRTHQKVVAFVGSCAPCSFQTVKTTRTARDEALESHKEKR